MRAKELARLLDGVDPEAEVFVAVQADPSWLEKEGATPADVDFEDDVEGEFCSTDPSNFTWQGGSVCILGDWNPE